MVIPQAPFEHTTSPIRPQCLFHCIWWVLTGSSSHKCSVPSDYSGVASVTLLHQWSFHSSPKDRPTTAISTWTSHPWLSMECGNILLCITYHTALLCASGYLSCALTRAFPAIQFCTKRSPFHQCFSTGEPLLDDMSNMHLQELSSMTEYCCCQVTAEQL